MKKYILLLLYFTSIVSYSQIITRGPDIGEIYFLGPTYTSEGLYYSTDFGETAVCVDSTINSISITADKTKGGIYCQKMPVNLYYSQNYGYENTWIFKQNDISDNIRSGVSEGTIFNHIASHSDDYGNNFINHLVNGFFGSLYESEIDNQIGTGYAVVKSSSIPDSVFLLISYDSFENLSIINKYHENENIFQYLTRGNNDGEIFTIRNRPFSFDPYEIYFSDNFGVEIIKKNELNINNHYSYSVEGGREEGEFFMIYNFVNLMWQNAHTYIYHSTDYGVTFEVFHPFAKGNEPVLSNFSTIDKEVHLTTPVEFCNYSIGEVLEYQWDFENDGIIDSYEETPTYVYQDTGYFSVKLSIVGQDSTNTFIKVNYIHVLDTTTYILENSTENISIYPNPFENALNVNSTISLERCSLSIYNLKGEKYLETLRQSYSTFMVNTSGLVPGVYILNISNQKESSNYKIIKK